MQRIVTIEVTLEMPDRCTNVDDDEVAQRIQDRLEASMYSPTRGGYLLFGDLQASDPCGWVVLSDVQAARKPGVKTHHAHDDGTGHAHELGHRSHRHGPDGIARAA